MDGVKEEEYGHMNVVIKVMSIYVSLCGKEVLCMIGLRSWNSHVK